MSGQRYSEEFKIEAIKQITERGHSIAEFAQRLGVTNHSNYNWMKKYSPSAAEYQARADIFIYIEMFCNIKRKHGSNNLLSPVNFKNQYRQQLESSGLVVAIQWH